MRQCKNDHWWIVASILVMLVFMASRCTTAPPKETVKPAPTPTTQPPRVIMVADMRKALFDKVENSDCAKASHQGGQGRAPIGFLRGVASTYAWALCNKSGDVYQIASQPLGDAKKDALTHYGFKGQSAEDRLNGTFSLIIGSAGQETSWRWCLGKDPGAQNTTAETCEAGLYQTSWNSRHAHPALRRLYDAFVEYPLACFEQEYKANLATCSAANLKNWGTGEGVNFQYMSKGCPGFATEYHAIMLRVGRSHYGPVNTKKSELKPQCTAMFESIRQLVAKDPAFCLVL